MYTKLAIELEVEAGSGLAFVSTQLNGSLATIVAVDRYERAIAGQLL
jgi:hypothetical protein